MTSINNIKNLDLKKDIIQRGRVFNTYDKTNWWHEDIPYVAISYVDGGKRKIAEMKASEYDLIHKLFFALQPTLTTAISGRMSTLKLIPTDDLKTNIDEFIKQAYERHIKTFFEDQRMKLKNVKAWMTMDIVFESGFGDKAIKKTITFRIPNKNILNDHELKNYMIECADYMKARRDDLFDKDSGLRFLEISNLHFICVKAPLIKGSSHIPLPKFLQKNKGVINPDNEDNECFRWAVLLGLHAEDRSQKNPGRITKAIKTKKDTLIFDNIQFPVAINDIMKFETNNNVSVNVLDYHEIFNQETKEVKHEIGILHRGIEVNNESREIDLIVISKGDKYHYCLINDLSKLLSHTQTHNCAHYYCRNCLHGYTTKQALDNHKRDGCYDNKPATTKLPSVEESIIEFKNYKKMLEAPFAIYLDFEALTTKITPEPRDPTSDMSYTDNYQLHEACSYSYYTVSKFEEYNKDIKMYRGTKPASKLIEELLSEQERIINIIENAKYVSVDDMIITDEQIVSYNNATTCHICSKTINEGDVKVRDHCHITGLYRGPAHNACNVQFNYANMKIPVFVHNLKGYDSHLIVQAFNKNHKNISCIPNNSEKYISFTLERLEFKDTFAFMASSLEKLVRNLPSTDFNAFKHTRREFLRMYPTMDDETFRLLIRKGVYPYDYMDSFDRFDERQLPSKRDFHSLLTDEDISDEDYNHAIKVWNKFNCRTIGDYHDLYLQLDVTLLADVFENFRAMSIKHYRLDPAHYYTSPGLSWDAGLLMTGVKLYTFNDQQADMHLFTEGLLRGGISMMFNRYSKANNKYMSSYDPTEIERFILYTDCNNLYGCSMISKLPFSGYAWADASLFTSDMIKQMDTDGDVGYALEVDLEYPIELHDLHNDYPLAVEKMAISNEMKSEYSIKLSDDLLAGKGFIPKLVPNLYNKYKYKCHIRNLKQYLQLGLKLLKVHRVLQFNQSAWLKPYIDFNTEQRQRAKNDFEKDFFKLQNNSYFGKTMENVRDRIDFQLVTTPEKHDKLTAQPRYKRSVIFNENLIGVERTKSTVLLNKPIIIGACILEISKTVMYDFHYNVMLPKYGDKLKVLMSDTDSLIYEIQTHDLYADMKSFKQHLDLSDYDKTNPLYDVTNKKVVGKFKDETNGVAIKEFIGLQSKMYSYITEDNETTKKAKGVNKSTVKKCLSIDDYRTTLFEATTMQVTQRVIRHKKHEVYSQVMSKRGLSSYDDKSYYLDNMNARRYGHYKNVSV